MVSKKPNGKPDTAKRIIRPKRQTLAADGVRNAGRAAACARELIELGETVPSEVSAAGAAFFAAVDSWNNEAALRQ